MKARRIQFNKYGDASEMYMGEYELPQLKPDDVLIKVVAAAVNPLDWKQRQGAMKLFMNRQFPKGIGSDFAGIVQAVGRNVSNVQKGDKVFGTMDVKHPGAFAEALVTKSRYVVKKTSQVSFEEAACLPIAATTAWAALLGKKPVSSHSQVLINGCTGAVGLTAVQLAIAKGAKVAGTCSQTSMHRAKLLGVDPVFNYNDEGYQKKAEPVDLIFDTAGTMNIGHALSMLKPRGKFIDINPTAGRIIRGVLSGRYKIVFATMGTKHLPEIAKLAAHGLLKPEIGLRVSFSNAVETIRAIENGQRIAGKVVFTFSGESM
ncbi:NAD(P)-dependent alcohol dehydrogenase [Ohtaekwangia kribbensis]|uniref:NAD(P)-dependent alcohol dehydrogenase n=1 Tax=Ohtaekwangia kribbensis TaxID=688913 RepID=A0ABW3KBU4_9BACT